MDEALEKLLSTDQIKQRVSELAAEITRDYHGKSLVVIGVLKGAFIFMSDLVRQLDLSVSCDFLRVSSYEKNESSGTVQLELDLSQPIDDQEVLLVEDIVDTGLTLQFLLAHLEAKRPKSIRVCSLLRKESKEDPYNKIDYLGFTIPDVYVVGYGLDYDGMYRSLPYIASLKS